MLTRLLSRFVEIRPGEGGAVVAAFSYFYLLLAGYYVLRPIREEIGVQGGVKALPWLFTATFVAMLMAVPFYSWVVSRFPRRQIVPIAYRFFAVTILLFAALFASGLLPEKSASLRITARVFFVMTAVYSLFITSLFWSVLAELFDPASAKRLFGFIAAGGTAGAITGPLIADRLVLLLGPMALLPVSALLLEAAVQVMGILRRKAPSRAASAPAEPLGGGAFEGFADVIRSPLLLGIAAQTLLFATTSTFLYLRHQAIVSASLDDAADRTQLFALSDFVVNATALLLQTLVTGAFLSRTGVLGGLAAVPAVSLVALPALAIAPSLSLVVAGNAVRRGVHYGLERPARETLFTAVTDRERYKAKSFIDTVVYRGADAVSGWIYAGLDALKLSTPAIFLSAMPFALAGVAVAGFLSKQHARKTGETQQQGKTETG